MKQFCSIRSVLIVLFALPAFYPCWAADLESGAHREANTQALNTNTPTAFSVKFEDFYQAWHQESKAISDSSRTSDYIGLPSYRKIVALGQASVPLLERKMRLHRELDFMLAFAVVEIHGWSNKEFIGEGGEQGFAVRVLQKLVEGRAAPENLVLARKKLPELTEAQRIALVKEANQAFSAHVRGDPKNRSNEISRDHWGPAITALKPLRVIDDLVNIKIVLVTELTIEGGFYINLPISSYAGYSDGALEFTTLSKPEDNSFGTIYRYIHLLTEERSK